MVMSTHLPDEGKDACESDFYVGSGSSLYIYEDDATAVADRPRL